MRNCPRCLNTAVIEDGYCGHCREVTMPPEPLNAAEQFLKDYDAAQPIERDALFKAFIMAKTESKTGLPVGVWFDNGDAVWSYLGTLSVVIQFAKPSPEYATEPMVVSKCPPCERTFLMAKWPSRKVKRWLILPP